MSRYTGKPGHAFVTTWTTGVGAGASCSCLLWTAVTTEEGDKARRSLEAQHRAHVGEEMGAT